MGSGEGRPNQRLPSAAPGFSYESVQVTLGLMTDTEVEITSGLEEGDVVSVVAISSEGAGQGFGPGRMFGGGGN